MKVHSNIIAKAAKCFMDLVFWIIGQLVLNCLTQIRGALVCHKPKKEWERVDGTVSELAGT